MTVVIDTIKAKPGDHVIWLRKRMRALYPSDPLPDDIAVALESILKAEAELAVIKAFE